MRITVDIYSGRPNPSWRVRGGAVADLAPDITAVQLAPPAAGPHALGYRRVVVQPEPGDEGLPAAEVVLGDVRTSFTEAEATLVRRLLATAGPALAPAEIAYVVRELDRVVREGGRPLPAGPVEPPEGVGGPGTDELVGAVLAGPYDPVFWNSVPQRLQCNNCYNYGTNVPTDTFAQPGWAGHQPIPEGARCSDVVASAVSDGLTQQPSAGNCYKVALVMSSVSDPLWDYHWYRYVSLPNGTTCWAHKPGSTPVTNLDSAGSVITDPQRCSRPGYPIWCGYLYVPIPAVVAGPGCPP